MADCYCTKCNEFFCNADIVCVKCHVNEVERLKADLVDATAELIYLRKYGKDGALWSANDSKDVWRDMARAALSVIPEHSQSSEEN